MTTPSTPLYREIQLTQGQVALVSSHRFEELNAFKWAAWWCPNTRTFYAVRHSPRANGKSRTVYMHRQILGLEAGDKREGDHVNLATLDNTDENLRVATSSQNKWNRCAPSNNTSGYKGVSWSKTCSKWRAYISVHAKQTHLGLFPTAEEARDAYLSAVKRFHGEFSRTSA